MHEEVKARLFGGGIFFQTGERSKSYLDFKNRYMNIQPIEKWHDFFVHLSNYKYLEKPKNNKLSKFDSQFCFSSILQQILYYSMDLKNDWS